MSPKLKSISLKNEEMPLKVKPAEPFNLSATSFHGPTSLTADSTDLLWVAHSANLDAVLLAVKIRIAPLP